MVNGAQVHPLVPDPWHTWFPSRPKPSSDIDLSSAGRDFGMSPWGSCVSLEIVFALLCPPSFTSFVFAGRSQTRQPVHEVRLGDRARNGPTHHGLVATVGVAIVVDGQKDTTLASRSSYEASSRCA